MHTTYRYGEGTLFSKPFSILRVTFVSRLCHVCVPFVNYSPLLCRFKSSFRVSGSNCVSQRFLQFHSTFSNYVGRKQPHCGKALSKLFAIGRPALIAFGVVGEAGAKVLVQSKNPFVLGSYIARTQVGYDEIVEHTLS